MTKDEKKALLSSWKQAQKMEYLLQKEQVEELFAFLEDVNCDHSLLHTKNWLSEHAHPGMVESILQEMREMGGYCDCEVLMNCYEDYFV